MNDDLKVEAGAFAMATGRATMTVRKPLPPDHPMHALVGRIAADWSQVEHVLDIVIWRLANVDDATGACLTGQIIGSFGRITAIYALSKHRGLNDEILAQITELQRKLKGSQDRRNRILHDAWYVTETDGKEVQTQQFKTMARDEWLFGFHDVDEAFITETLAKIGRRLKESEALLAITIDALQ
jgi:hypothetical protein